MDSKVAEPKPTLSVTDAVAIIVGIVVGVFVFKAPSFVASNTGDGLTFLSAWLLGGIISLIGALCYAELATAYPHAGGDYHYLTRAFGRDLAFLFAWARMTVIQTGSIATLAFAFGDYATQILPLGKYSSPLYTTMVIIILTTMNVMGVEQGKWTQNLLTAAKVLGLLSVIAIGLLFAVPPADVQPSDKPPQLAFGMAMIFVLFTYGGWNEAAYISAELRDVRRNMVRALVWGIGIITAIYLLASLAYLKGLGIEAMAKSEVVAADLLRRFFGEGGAKFISLLVVVSALGAINGTIFTGARTNYALGKDFSLLRFLGQWHERANTPVNSLLVQGVISLALVSLGAWTKQGFETMVAYTTPVFWFFFFLAGLSLFRLRSLEPRTPRPFRVPFYPITPLLFCATCLYMLYSSLNYALFQLERAPGWSIGVFVGIAVLLAGIPVLMLARRS